MKSKWVRWAVAFAIAFGAIFARMSFESRQEWNEAERLLAAGQTREAIIHYDRSIHWYAPGLPYPERSLRRLKEIAVREEARDEKLALFAYDSMRGAIFSIRSILSPYSAWLPAVNDRIADLRSREQVREQPQTKLEEARAFHLRALSRDERPKMSWLLVTIVGFFGWVGSVFGFIWKGFNRQGDFQKRASIPWGLAFLASFLLWIAGMLRA